MAEEYGAQMLPTGEVVPVAAPILQSSRLGNQFVLTWRGNFQLLSASNVIGPYQLISGAASPCTNDLQTAPQRFFMLQGQ